MDDERRLHDIVAAALDGSPVDWDAAESGATPADRQLVQELRLVAQIAGFSGFLAECMPADGNEAPSVPGRESRPPGTERWGHLQLIEEIGEGASGCVYRALDVRLNREVALKLVSGVRTQTIDSTTAIDEGRKLARVRHPNVVTVYGADYLDGRVGVWTELLRGETLAAIVKRSGPFTVDQAVSVVVDVCKALSAVHDAGLLHRDVKAQNVMCEDDGRIVLMDFGISHDLDAGLDETSGGTPLYMGPELFNGAATTRQSDIYSVGVLLYHLLTASYPVNAPTLAGIRQAHERNERQSHREMRVEVPALVMAAIQRATAPNPDDRFATADDFQEALAAAIAPPTARDAVGPPRRSAERSLFRAVFVVSTAALAVALAIYWSAARPTSGAASGRAVAAAPTFHAGDWVLVCSFDNHTGDPSLDRIIEYGLERALGASSFVNVVPAERVEDVLRLMRKAPLTRVSREVGLEVWQRDRGIHALVTGDVYRRGGGYLISSSVVDPHVPGRPMLTASLEAPDLAHLVPAIRRLSVQMRRALSEPGDSVRDADNPLDQVTTASLAAARFYTDAVRAASIEQWELSDALAKKALAADPAFASAHAWLAFVAAREGRRADALASVAKAIQFAGGASRHEQMAIGALDRRLHGRASEAFAEYQRLFRAYPDDYWAVEQLLGLPGSIESPEATIQLSMRAADLRPNNFRANVNAAFVLMTFGGRVPDAQPYLAKARVAAPLDPEEPGWLRLEPVFEDWLRGDIDSAAARLDAAHDLPDSRPEWLIQVGGLDLALGRLRAAESSLARIDQTTNAMLFKNAEVKRLQIAFARDDGQALRRWVDSRLKSGQPYGDGVSPLWLMRRYTTAGMLQRFVEPWATNEQGPAVAAAEGEVALSAGRVQHAAALLRNAWRSMPLGSAPSLDTARSCAWAFEREGDLQKAVAELEDATRDKGRLYQGIGSTIPAWIRARVDLARLYHRLSRKQEAEATYRELSRLLSRGDPDLRLLEEIQP